MIVTQRITSTTAIPDEYENFETINVLKWTGKWKALCPYYLRTDGLEEHANPGGVIFENYWQASKVYPVVYAQTVHPSRYQQNRVLWEYTPRDNGIILNSDDSINYDLYYEWRDSLWACQNAIRYPNGYTNRSSCKFGLFIAEGKEERLDYIQMRKRVYVQEYIRLVRKTDEYKDLLEMHKSGKNLMICEIDVPSQSKKGEYGKCSKYNTRKMTIKRLTTLLNDPNEAFGHGLCLCLALLQDDTTNV